MSANLFLVNYANADEQNLYDDGAITVEETFIDDEIFTQIQPFLVEKEILESKNAPDTVKITVLPNDKLLEVESLLTSSYLKKIDDLNQKVLDKNISDKIIDLGIFSNILKIIKRKTQEFHNHSSILIMIG